MKVLIAGNGGREHALAWKIRQSALLKELYCAPGNAGIARVADCVPIESSSIVELADFASTIRADLTIVGPELPMVLGIGDEFARRGLRIFCPSRAAAEIEGSKVFAREFMARHDIPSPRFRVCDSPETATAAIDSGEFAFPLVIKADGLAAGKGAVIVQHPAEARSVVTAMMTERRFGNAGARIVIEEFVEGEEVSFLVFSDGTRVVPMVSAQDHKRALDGDQGPNTGGMGSVSPATTLSLEGHKRIMQEIVLPAISGMAAEGRKYQGVLYAGLMMTEQGPKVLEFNARFGDPETQVVLSRMKSDILPILLGVAEGNMGETKIEWMREAAACVVIASRGYPETPETGKVIHGLETLEGESGVIAFHAATAVRDGRLVTVGGRVLGVTALGATMAAAIQRAYEAVDKVSFEGMHFRRDIGRKALARLQATA